MKNIVIIGASRGIGLALVKQLVKENQVLAISRQTDSLLKISADTLTVRSMDLNALDFKKSLSALLKETGAPIDLLINNAGYLVNKPFLALDRADIAAQFNTNVIGIMEACQACIPFMQPNSHIVNIGSMGGFQGSSKFAGLSAYSSSKAAVASFTECLAEEMQALGIKANCLALGAVQTEMLAAAFPGYEAPVSATDMAAYIADFGLNAHHWINGKVIPVSLSTP
ncbi:short-chain dehydrogenase [Putridiphycobacter roseus]|uniref:Short-chain dehydrogenase n=1 Tax=Putridiphycobacter roseus TaxID=2219161 RepID=A0A2W1N3Z7_9FLAO|nr:SDR family NAD(P)-dependent oxidoreductase [Putridiphycobacter roseus]PZE17771.1 short-chain dehydrogenase [Putridiphycobacter roseus]